MNEWLTLAFEASVVKRALKFAAVVGTILNTINHLPAILHGDFNLFRLYQMCLTCLVPYCVSTLSSVGAIRRVRAESVAREMQASK